jgi:hypothetical protein
MRYDTPLRISVLIPTRKRVDSLKQSIDSLIKTASTMEGIEFLIAIDEDDEATKKFIGTELVEELNNSKIEMRSYVCPRQGYAKLHNYYNELSKQSIGNWLLLWNDDAIMQTDDWDLAIEKYNGQMKVLRFRDNHNEHPNAIFPCVPKDWVLLFGEFSANHHSDTWISQLGYITDCIQNVPEVYILHDRHDLTGNNDDHTAEERELLESNLDDPRDINHPDFMKKKIEWALRLNWYLHKTNQNTGWFDKFLLDNSFDVWAKFREADVNKQCFFIEPMQVIV